VFWADAGPPRSMTTIIAMAKGLHAGRLGRFSAKGNGANDTNPEGPSLQFRVRGVAVLPGPYLATPWKCKMALATL